MSERPREATELHTRLLKCALEIEDSRAYWAHADGSGKANAQKAFDEYWFGARSLSRIEMLLANMRARFDALTGCYLTFIPRVSRPDKLRSARVAGDPGGRPTLR